MSSTGGGGGGGGGGTGFLGAAGFFLVVVPAFGFELPPDGFFAAGLAGAGSAAMPEKRSAHHRERGGHDQGTRQ